MTEDCRQELLPCPFCGGEAKIESKQGSFGYSNAHHSVTCVSCGVSTPRVGERYPAAEAEREAIKAASVQWNRRASVPAPEVTEEMVERAAKAMFDNVYHAAQVPESDWYAIWLREAAYHKTLARVALNTALKGTV